MRKRIYRLVIDTNLWISFLITNDFRKLDELIEKRKVTLVVCRELIREILIVARRPKFTKYFSNEKIDKVLSIIENYGEFVETTVILKICRDPKDNYLLDLATQGLADFLISGDIDLLELKEIENTKIITISEFINKYC